MKKELERIPVHYAEIEHVTAMREGYGVSVIFNQAVAELETIIKKPIEDYKAFRKDILGYSIEAIKTTFPVPFTMGLDDEATLKMMSIDISKLEQYSEKLKTTPHRFNVCAKSGKASACENEEPYTYYAETPEHFERLDFSNKIIEVAEKAHSYNRNQNKGNIIAGFTSFVINDPQKGLIPNWQFVVNGI